MTTWFSADLHLRHGTLIRVGERPFSTTEEMDEAIVANWNSVVKPKDQVYLLGDVCLGRPAEGKVLLDRLNGEIFLVKGNYDKKPFLKVCESRFT